MHNNRLNILIVDDEPRVLRALSRLLKPHYEVYQAENGSLAMDIIRTKIVHIIVSDQRMPEMTGIDLLAKVKLVSPDTIRILLTGYSDLFAVIGAVNNGEIFRFITKPWVNDDFLETIRQAGDISRTLSENSTKSIAQHKDRKNIHADSDNTKKVIILAPGDELVHAISRYLGSQVESIQVKTLSAASQILIEDEVCMILMDINLDDKEALAFIKTAKVHKPDVLCLVVADSADIAHTMSLINEGQIFRILTRPLKLGQLNIFLNSAMRYYNQISDRPELIARHAVQTISNDEEIKISNNFKKMWGSLRETFMNLR